METQFVEVSPAKQLSADVRASITDPLQIARVGPTIERFMYLSRSGRTAEQVVKEMVKFNRSMDTYLAGRDYNEDLADVGLGVARIALSAAAPEAEWLKYAIKGGQVVLGSTSIVTSMREAGIEKKRTERGEAFLRSWETQSDVQVERLANSFAPGAGSDANYIKVAGVAGARLRELGIMPKGVPVGTDDAGVTVIKPYSPWTAFGEEPEGTFVAAPQVGAAVAAGTVQPNGNVKVDAAALKEALKGDLADIVKRNRESAEEVLAEFERMQNQNETLVSWVKAQQDSQAEQEAKQAQAAARQAVIDAVKGQLDVAEAGLGAVLSIAKLVDPRTARDIELLGGASLNVARTGVALVQSAVNLSAAKVVEAALGVGTAVATFNFIGAAVQLIGLLIPMPKQPPPDARILEQIDALREQMARFEEGVHERFDRIDRNLNTIYTDVMTELGRIDVKLGQLKGQLGEVQAVLARHSAALERIERNQVEFLRELARDELSEAMESALRRTLKSSSPTMTLEEYQRFSSKFLTWAVNTAFDPHEAPVIPTDDADLAAFLEGGAASEHLSLIVAAVRDRGWPSLASAGTEVPNPRTWAIAASAFAELDAAWPQLAVRVNDLDLDGSRNRVIEVGHTIRKITTAVTIAAEPPAQAEQPVSPPVGDAEPVVVPRATLLELACRRVADRANELGAAMEAAARGATLEGYAIWLPQPPETWEYIPGGTFDAAVTERMMHTGTALRLPPEALKRIPAFWRAVHLLHRHYTGGQLLGNADMDLGMQGVWVRIFLTLDVPAGFNVPPSDSDPAPGDFDPPEVISAWWARHPQWNSWVADAWAPLEGEPPGGWLREEALGKLRQQWPEMISGPTARWADKEPEGSAREWCRRLLADYRNRCAREQVFPHVVAEMGRDRSVWLAARAYDGARALFVALIAVGMPRQRENDDVLVALLDGYPPALGGVGLAPSEVLAAAMLQAQPRCPDTADQHPLQDFVVAQVSEPLTRLRTYLAEAAAGAQAREAARKQAGQPPALPGGPDPVISEALERLRLSRRIVHTQAALQNNPPPSPPPSATSD